MPPIRADRNWLGGGLLVYIKEGVPTKEVSLDNSTAKEVEAKAFEIIYVRSNGQLLASTVLPNYLKTFL